MRCRVGKGRWTVMICRSSREGRYGEALDLLRDLQRRGQRPGHFILPSLLRACGGLSDLGTGEKLHGSAIRSSFDADVFVSCALIDMYSRCGHIDGARKVFDTAAQRDTVVWNSMLASYVRLGFAGDAMRLFVSMVTGGLHPDLTTWNSLISGCSSSGALKIAKYLFRSMKFHGVDPDVFSWTSLIGGLVRDFRGQDAFEAFRRMMVVPGVQPSSATVSSLLPACANLADDRRGAALHAYAVVTGVEEDLFVSSALVDMYSKCGFLHEAAKMFNRMRHRSTVSWNSMIFGYANNGSSTEAVNIYNQMRKDGVDPDHLTFTALLTACSHGGLVELGMAFFRSMQEERGIEPRAEHYACMVDLLGRAGRLLEALDLIEGMPVAPDIFVWGALLGACRNHGNVEVAVVAASHLLKVETERRGSYLMMSGILAGSGRWEDAVRMKMMAKRQTLRGNPGCSWITTP
ncbi:unnamed protein product [Spirodela intermedia]|uniref:Uncharacterized protein n=1 Tax=Spirodela intermedia TaxID=51605 RepID=A0A7I8K056_SPIIN|nr:unnamed protein product [Spirodela intermedia]